MIQLHQDEKIILEQRKHWYVISTRGAILVLLAIISLVIVSALFQSSAGPVLKAYWPHILLLMSGWFLLLWIVFFILWTNYYLDVLLITNKRLLDIEQFGLFSRDVVDIPLAKVQDVKVEITGLMPTMLNFGNVRIQTAGATQEVVINNLAEPHKVQKIVSKLYFQGSGQTEPN